MATITIGGVSIPATRIDELDQTLLHSRDHVVPAMHDGVTVRLTIAQVLSLLKKEDLPFDPDDKLDLAGGTMLGDLDMGGKKVTNADLSDTDALRYASQALTAGQQGQARANIDAGVLSGFRNKIINGDFTINQRGAVTKAQAVGVYGYDRWKGHANGLEQIIEGLPAGTYTLTFGGGGTGSVDGQTPAASPAVFTVGTGGDISVVVPSTATRVSLVEGDATAEDDPFSPRHIQQELALCQRYYETGGARLQINADSTARGQLVPMSFAVLKRVVPTMSVVSTGAVSNATNLRAEFTTQSGFAYGHTTGTSGGGAVSTASWSADAEI